MESRAYEFDPLEQRDPRTVGGYPLRARIGAGGMGRVYLSFTPGGRAVAVKLIRPEFAEDPEFRERFAREVAIAQRVNGIHIAQLIDSGADAGAPWLASAYVPGPSLGETVAATGPVAPGTVLALAGRIAESLAAVHATGMVHRDLKPGNILLDETGPKVIDFGIVRAVTPTATGRSSHRTFIGSPPFMAPEQIRGRKITPAADVFALGATIYFLATGTSAFQADFADGVLYRVLHDEPDYEACPPEIRELVRACLHKEPEERPDTTRIIEGCRAAGADRAPLLPEGVIGLIEARKRALAALAPGTGDETAPEPAQPSAAPQIPLPVPGSAAAALPEPLSAALPAAGPAVLPADSGAAAGAPPWQAAPTLPPPRTAPADAAASAATSAPPAANRPVPAGSPPGRGRLALAAASGAAATAVVAVIAVSVLHLLPSHNTNNPDNIGTGTTPAGHTSQIGQSSASTQTSATAQTSTATPATGTGAAGGDAVRWQGQVLLSVNGVDLDSVPVNNAASTNSTFYNSSTGLDGSPETLTAQPLETTSLATWNGSGTPGRTQCLDQVESQGVNQLSVTDGTDVCVVSLGQHVALMKITDTAANGGILATVTVWAQAAATASPT